MKPSTPAAPEGQTASGDTASPLATPSGAGTTADNTTQRSACAGGDELENAAYDDGYEPL